MVDYRVGDVVYVAPATIPDGCSGVHTVVGTCGPDDVKLIPGAWPDADATDEQDWRWIVHRQRLRGAAS